MNLDTYEGLKQEVIDFSHRDDIDLKIDTFIRIAETTMFNPPSPVSPLSVRGQQTRSTSIVSTTSRYLALPPGYLSMRRLRLILDDRTWNVRQTPPDQMHIMTHEGRPPFFTITSEIEFDRVPDALYTAEIQYWRTPTPLSSDNQSNEVLANNPNIYLFGTLWALFRYADEDIKTNEYLNLFLSAVSGANKQFKKGRHDPSPAMRVVGSTP